MTVREAPERLLQHAGALGARTPPPCSTPVTIVVLARRGNSSVTYSIYSNIFQKSAKVRPRARRARFSFLRASCKSL